MKEPYYKVLYPDGRCFHGGKGSWHLPSPSGPGKWMPKISTLDPCQTGYHILKQTQILQWLGPAIFEVESRGEEIWQQDKGIVQEARLLRQFDFWTEQTMRLFVCDCAERVLHFANDSRSTAAVLAARKFAFKLISTEELKIAEDAAWAAARAAAWAAWDARDTWAAWDAEQKWQTSRLFQYLNGDVDLVAIKASL